LGLGCTPGGEEKNRGSAPEKGARAVREVRARVRFGPDPSELLDLECGLERRGIEIAAAEHYDRRRAADRSCEPLDGGIRLGRLADRVGETGERERASTARFGGRRREERERDARGGERLCRCDLMLDAGAEREHMLGAATEGGVGTV